jgi:SRSO17 transposase
MMLCVVVELAADELDRVLERVEGRFARAEPRARVRSYVAGLTAGLERKNGWTLAEQAGEGSPDGMQRLLRWADWDVDGVRDDLRSYVVEHLGDRGGVLIADETGFIKKGTRSAGVQRQYSGTAGRTENCQIGVFLAYASRHGHALIDRELYLPQSWTDDRDRCRAAGIPQEVEFATKPRQAQAMIARAIEAGVPFGWFTGDEVYGQAKWLQDWLQERGVFYVMAIRCCDTVPTEDGEQRADALISALSPQCWQRISAGAGAHGPREHHWARIPVRRPWAPGRGCWLLARRSLRDPEQITYYACYGPARASTATLAAVAGSRWHIEECFQQAKNEAGLDHYQVRTWRAWYAHITLSMLALAWLSASRARAVKGAPAPATRA